LAALAGSAEAAAARLGRSAATRDDDLEDLLLSGRRDATEAPAGRSPGRAAAPSASRPVTPGTPLSSSLSALRPGSASASVLDASPAEVWRRASALSSAGALEGAEWPMEAAAAASAVVERSWDEGQAVVASGDPCRFVSVSRGVLRAPDGEQDIPAGRSLGLEALASRDAGRRFEETMTAGPGGAVTLELGAAALTRAVAGAWERRRARRVEALGSVPLLRALLDADELVLLAGLCRERRCPAGSLVAAQGSPATSALVVLRGHLSLVEDRALAFEGDGRLPPELVHRASLGPGAACGADALLRARGWRASVLAWAPELDAVVSLGGPEEGAPDPVTGAVPGVVPAPVHESLAGREVGFASDCLLLEVPRDAVREACGTDLLLRCRERAPQRFAEEMGRLA